MRRWISRTCWGLLITLTVATAISFATSWVSPYYAEWYPTVEPNDDLLYIHVSIESTHGRFIFFYEKTPPSMGSSSEAFLAPEPWWHMPRVEFLNPPFKGTSLGFYSVSLPYWFILGFLLCIAAFAFWRRRIRRARQTPTPERSAI